MKVRLISAAIGIVICIALFILGEMNTIVLQVAVSLVTGLLCGELLTAKGLHKNLKISLLCIAFGFFMPMLCTTAARFLPLYIFTVVLFVLMVVFHDSIRPDDTMFAYGGTLLITLSMTSLVLVSCSDNDYPSFYIVLCLGVPWLADSGAYFSGVFFGKKKLCPQISPKKTVEGAVGGLISGVIGSIIIGFVFLLIYSDVQINFWAVALIGLINPVISIFGDLTFSVIKRACDIKDYGSIMPGHGGLLDRFDSVILCAPLVFIVSNFVTIIS